MKKLFLSLTTLGFATALSCGMAWAQEMDVDQADSLNFEGFHKDKKEAIKVWEKSPSADKSQTVKAYDLTPPASTSNAVTSTSAAVTPSPAVAAKAGDKAPATATVQNAGEVKPGQRYEIRERYTLSRSNKTPYSAFYVLEPLHKQAVQLCPRGWKKLTERSEPVEQDFYLYFELECL